MTTKQRMAILSDWWPSACATQHWDPRCRRKRLEVISDAVGRPVTTMSDLDNSADIDQVKAYLKYLADDIDGARELHDRDPGDRRRYLWLIHRHSHRLSDPSHKSDSSDSYALSVARDRFHLAAGLTTLEDLSTEQLRQLMMTLWARLQPRRRRNASLTSEETFPDQVAFETAPEPELISGPF